MESHRVKTVNTDKRSRKRLKFASAREKSKYATADIYRSYKRKLGTTSSSTSQREEAVHSNNNKLKRQKRISSTSSSSKSSTTTITSTTNDGRTSIVRSSSRKTKDKKEEEDAAEYDTIDDNNNLMETSLSSTTTTTTFFSDELDIAFDRNGSEIFQQFHRQIWKLCRSLPEILHHSNEIVDILLSYMLSPYDAPGTPTPITADGTSTSSSKENDTTKDDDDKKKTKSSSSSSSSSYSINHATMDILHLISVLARDLRHEIHPYVHTKIVPRIIYDMLNSPPPSATSATSTSKSSRSQQQQQKGEGEDQTETQKQQQRQVIPLDITIVEAAFRTISYLFKYDTTTTSTIASTKAAAAAASKEHQQEEEKGNDATNIMEIMRKYYGPTLVHRRDIVRHLASETFAPVIRNMKSDTSRQRHLKRVLRALVMSSTSTTSTTSPVSSSTTMSKTQVDAIDGISKLIFQIIKGVRGKLHSKGIQIIRFLLEFLTQDKSVIVASDATSTGSNSNTAGHDMIYKIVSSVLDQTCRHIDNSNYVILLNEILDVLDKNIIPKLSPSSNTNDTSNGSSAKKEKKTKSTKNSSSSSAAAAAAPDAAVVPLLDVMKLLAQTLSSSNHLDTLTHKSNNKNISQLLNILEILCKRQMISMIQSSKSNDSSQGNEDQVGTLLSLFCKIWVSIHRVPKFDTYLQGFVSSILDTDNMNNIKKKKENASGEYERIQKRALNLSQNLLPFLPHDMAAKSVATCLLVTAAKIVEYNNDVSLHIVFTVAAMRLQGGASSTSDPTGDEDEHDDLFFPENGSKCNISGPEKDALLKACLLNIDLDQLTRDEINKLGLALRCIPFIAMIRREKEDSKKALSYFKRMSKWIVRILDGIPSSASKKNDVDYIKPIDRTIVTALALESLSKLATTASGAMQDVSTVEKTLKRTISIAEKFLFSDHDSILAVKSVAAFVEALQAFKIPFSDNSNQVFDGLVGNLRSSSHFLRMRTLQILASYPTKPFVTDHADLDLDGDLDEEPSATPGGDQVRSGPTGPCDILETLLHLESVPIALANERQLLSLVSRVEVLGRTGKLPVAYAEAAANHMIGMFHVKFSPLWAASARALGALAIGHEDSVWPTLEAQLAAVIERPPDQGLNEEVHSDTEQSSLDQHQLCINWETSVGMDSTLFRNNVSPEVEGKVSRYHATDGETVMESVWRVLEDNPQLLAKHSRVLVPVFIRFLHCQYYFFHSSDPDARELSLHEHVVGPLR